MSSVHFPQEEAVALRPLEVVQDVMNAVGARIDLRSTLVKGIHSVLFNLSGSGILCTRL